MIEPLGLHHEWSAWRVGEEWIPLKGEEEHAERALQILDALRVAGPWRERKPGSGDRAFGYLIDHGAIRQRSLTFLLRRLDRPSLEAIQDRIVEMARREPGLGDKTMLVMTSDEVLRFLGPVRDFLGVGSPRELTSNPSRYLEAVKRQMAEGYRTATTDNPSQSGYLLADGTWLNMGMYGERGDDHRVVAGFVGGKLGKQAYAGDRWPAVVQWMKVTKSIRWLPENCAFDCYTAPTEAQLAEMSEMTYVCAEVTVEATGPRGRHMLRAYGRRQAQRLRSEVKGFFEGRNPEDEMEMNGRWEDVIRGEWWIYEGEELYSDQDVGDKGHEAQALDMLLDGEALIDAWEAAWEGSADLPPKDRRELGDDPPDFDELRGEVAEFGASGLALGSPTVPNFVGRQVHKDWDELVSDPRFAFMKRGAILVIDRNFGLLRLTRESIEDIQGFLLERADGEEEALAGDIFIEEIDTGRTASVAVQDFLVMKQPGQVLR